MPSLDHACETPGNLPPVPTRAQRRERTHRALVTAARSTSPRRRQALLDYVVRLNLCIAHDVAIRHLQPGRDNDAVLKAAHDALARAARDFDPDGPGEFVTFAVAAIRREVEVHSSQARAVPGATGWTPGT